MYPIIEWIVVQLHKLEINDEMNFKLKRTLIPLTLLRMFHVVCQCPGGLDSALSGRWSGVTITTWQCVAGSTTGWSTSLHVTQHTPDTPHTTTVQLHSCVEREIRVWLSQVAISELIYQQTVTLAEPHISQETGSVEILSSNTSYFIFQLFLMTELSNTPINKLVAIFLHFEWPSAGTQYTIIGCT